MPRHVAVFGTYNPPIALVTSVSADGNATVATTAAVNTTGSNLIILVAALWPDGGGSPSMSDSAGNTWTALTQYSGGRVARLYYKVNPTISATHTFTHTTTGGNGYPAIAMMAFSGAAGGYNSVENGAWNNSATTLQTGSVTPTVNDCVVVTGLSFDDVALSGNATISNSFTVAQSLSSDIAVAAAYKIQTTLGAENPTWTSPSPAAAMATGIAVFKRT